MAPQSVLIVGASQGLGKALVHKYSTLLAPQDIYATVRSPVEDGTFPKGVNIIEGVDASQEDVGDKIVQGLAGRAMEIVVVVAGILKPEASDPATSIARSTDGSCAISGAGKGELEGSGRHVHDLQYCSLESLLMSSSLTPHAKVALLTSEGGSIGLRTESEGGGMFGHHGSKAAGNMVGHLLAYDLKKKDAMVVMIHPGFLKTGMTKGAGMEEYYEKMGAVTPEEAAVPFVEFVEDMTMEMSGKFWAPMGGRGIGNAEEVLGKKAAEQTTPLELPW
ncbi:hypothetical protein P7C73_g983, partial [Tremellales sp. Uapishka_1]